MELWLLQSVYDENPEEVVVQLLLHVPETDIWIGEHELSYNSYLEVVPFTELFWDNVKKMHYDYLEKIGDL